MVSTIEVLCGLQAQQGETGTNRPDDVREAFRRFARIMIRILTVVMIVFLAVVFPAFDRIMALMGSCLCFTICVILPITFYLRIFGKEIGRLERTFDWILLIVSSVLAVLGTLWAFLPTDAMFGNSLVAS